MGDRSNGGAFKPDANYTVTGDWTFSEDVAITGDLTVTGTIADSGSSFTSPTITGTVAGGATYTAPVLTTPNIGVATATSVNKLTFTAPATTATLTLIEGTVTTGPAATGTLVTEAGAVTLTNKTITAPVLSGSVTGTYTLAGTPTLTAPTINGAINTDFKVLAAAATYDNQGAPQALTGFSWAVVAGTYTFDVNLPTTMTTNGGLELSFVLTTAVLTSIQYQTYAATASDNTTAVSTTGTTTASTTKIFDSKTAAYTWVRATGSMVVGTGGTFAWFGCQETAASGGDSTIIALGAYARMTRVA